jgi:histidine triad (HIT) family protein
MPDCIFCKIARGEVPSKIVFEDDRLKAFHDMSPKAPVHVLLIPKEHVESIAHLKSDHRELAGDLLMTAREVAADLSLTGYKLVFNVGRDGGQSVDHLHLHILGGWPKGTMEGEENQEQLKFYEKE